MPKIHYNNQITTNADYAVCNRSPKVIHTYDKGFRHFPSVGRSNVKMVTCKRCIAWIMNPVHIDFGNSKLADEYAS